MRLVKRSDRNVRFPPIPDSRSLVSAFDQLRTLARGDGLGCAIHGTRFFGEDLMRPFTTIAAAIFLLMALVHVYRVTVGFPVKVGTLEITQAISWIALIVSLVLAVGLFREARR